MCEVTSATQELQVQRFRRRSGRLIDVQLGTRRQTLACSCTDDDEQELMKQTQLCVCTMTQKVHVNSFSSSS